MMMETTETPAATPTPETTTPPATPQKEGTLLDGAVGRQSTDPWDGDDWQKLVPDKFLKDGQIDPRVLAKSYAHLETRMRSGEAPPQDISGYKLEYKGLPEGTQIDPEREKSFLSRAHGKGLNNGQVQFIMDELGQFLASSEETVKQNRTDAEGKLRQEWGEHYDTQLATATKVFELLADDRDRAEVAQFGNNPAVLRFLAKVGANLKEDMIPSGSPISGADLESLMKSEAYWNPKHPDHRATNEKVKAHYERTYPKR
jgi:hypothetical protein